MRRRNDINCIYIFMFPMNNLESKASLATGTKCSQTSKQHVISCKISQRMICIYPDSKVRGANMGLIWGRQDPGGPMLAAWTSRTFRDACRDRCLVVSFKIGGGEDVPGIPDACATRNFTFLVRGPWKKAVMYSLGIPFTTHTALISDKTVSKSSLWTEFFNSLYRFSILTMNMYYLSASMHTSVRSACSDVTGLAVPCLWHGGCALHGQ